MNPETAEAPTGAPVITFKKRGNKVNLRKRPTTPPLASSDSETYSSGDESGRKVKRPRKSGLVGASTTTMKPRTQDLSATKFAADRSATIETSNDATKQSNWYDENELSSKNLLGKTRPKVAPSDVEANAVPDETYKGASAYSNFIRKNPNVPSRQVGPMKASTNIRTITITDFAPDVCKDYKQTGFCGFGDSCKFLHAREDYKQGWALDREWEISTKGKKQDGKVIASADRGTLDGSDEEEDAALLEKVPFACIICKKPYTSPVVTRCGHYFCEACALQRYRKKPDCAACGAGTNGVFNGAKGLQKLLERKRKREERLKEKAKQEDEEKGKSV